MTGKKIDTSGLETPKFKVDFSDLKEVFDKLVKEVQEKRDEEDWDWDLKITRVSNAYILDGISDSGIDERSVIEDDDIDELKSHERLLWAVMEYFGFGGSKHDAERIKIVREPQK